MASLDPVIGSEQGKTRSVMVISDDEINGILPVVNILPLTSKKEGRKIYPNEALLTKKESGLHHDSIVLCYQIRTLDKKRLIKKLGSIRKAETQQDILNALKFQLGLYR